jgi:predicted RNA methylase
MSDGSPEDRPGPRYDRQLLLHGPKRDAVLELWEVRRYGMDTYGDADYVSVYGLRPADWYARGVRLLGRSTVECTRDSLAETIATDVASVAATAAQSSGPLVIDPFVGTGNTLHWILRRLNGARGMGFELDPSVFRLTSRNLALLGLPIDIVNDDSRLGLAGVAASGTELVVAFVAPPWGEALSERAGLDLRRTTPPVASIIDAIGGHFQQNRMLWAVQIHETVVAQSLYELKPRFDWSAIRMYRLNAAGQNHGILLGSKGWMPQGQGGWLLR